MPKPSETSVFTRAGNTAGHHEKVEKLASQWKGKVIEITVGPKKITFITSPGVQSRGEYSVKNFRAQMEKDGFIPNAPLMRICVGNSCPFAVQMHICIPEGCEFLPCASPRELQLDMHILGEPPTAVIIADFIIYTFKLIISILQRLGGGNQFEGWRHT
ncbi:hypothetical protein FOXYSP1_13253 [Fusarium oxysporum f. sp. phaseoli]